MKLLPLLPLFLLTLLPGAFGQQDTRVDMQIVAKQYSSGYVPVTDSYVEYEVSLENDGETTIEDRTLEVSLLFGDGLRNSSAAFSVPALNPGDSVTLHLGPFKMEGEGEHRFVAEIDGVELLYEPDSFTVYRQEAVYAIFVSIPLIAAGAGIAGFSLYRRRRSV